MRVDSLKTVINKMEDLTHNGPILIIGSSVRQTMCLELLCTSNTQM